MTVHESVSYKPDAPAKGTSPLRWRVRLVCWTITHTNLATQAPFSILFLIYSTAFSRTRSLKGSFFLPSGPVLSLFSSDVSVFFFAGLLDGGMSRSLR